MTESVIDVNQLSKSFGNRLVVDKVSLHVKRGEVFGFLGPNGSGKTTTIRMICGLLTPDSGHGTCLGFDIVRQSESIKRKVGYMTQQFSFYTDLTVQENLEFVARVYEIKHPKTEIERTLSEFGFNKRRKQLAGELSGGWKQRLALAACLLHKPSLLLLDEPTAGVDPLARREFWDKIHALSEAGITVLVSTHYMDEAERCTRLAYLAYGHLVIEGTVDDVIHATNLFTFRVTGAVTTRILQEVKSLDGVRQAALFGNELHVSGYDKTRMMEGLHALSTRENLTVKPMKTTLEDAFISLVNQSGGQFA